MLTISEFIVTSVYSALVGGATGIVLLWIGANSYKKRIASLGDDNGSIKIEDVWYVIKREGE